MDLMESEQLSLPTSFSAPCRQSVCTSVSLRHTVGLEQCKLLDISPTLWGIRKWAKNKTKQNMHCQSQWGIWVWLKQLGQGENL